MASTNCRIRKGISSNNNSNTNMLYSLAPVQTGIGILWFVAMAEESSKETIVKNKYPDTHINVLRPDIIIS